MSSGPYTLLFGRKIYHNETFFLLYCGGFRELDSKKQKEWNKTLGLPLLLKIEEQRKLGDLGNPNVVPVTGIQLLEFVKELKFVPIFDKFFEHSHRVKLTDLLVYESIKAKNYEIAMRG